MAKARFKARTTEIIKAKYVAKKTFKRGLFAFGCILLLLGISIYRLYQLGEFKDILKQLHQVTTYCSQFKHFIKGLF